MKKSVLIIGGCLAILLAHAQNAAINTDGSLPHASAILDIKSTDKGLLIPRINLTSDSDVTTINSPRVSLLVYNTNASLPDGEGYYYFNGNAWTKFATRNNLANLAWNIGGNKGTNPQQDFIGTADNKPLVFKTDSILSGKIDPAGNNVFFGQGAGSAVSTGGNNSFFGHQAGLATSSGQGNLFMGHNAGFANTSGYTNVYLGQAAGKNSATGIGNVCVGEGAGFSMQSSIGTIAVGNNALYKDDLGTRNIALGYEAMYNNKGGSFNNALGYQTLYSNTTGDFNVAVGDQALYFNTTGDVNTALGYWALFNNTTGRNNIAMGYAALYRNTEGIRNIALGVNTLQNNTTGDYNSVAGDSSMFYNTTGYSNAAFGINTLQNNTTGHENAAFGAYTLQHNTTGIYNAAFGRTALTSNTNGDRNAAFGVDAMRNNVSGFQNTACGNSALLENLVGDHNTAIGYTSGPATGFTSLNNTTAVGYNANVTSSNTMVFGDGNVDRWAFGISTTNANHALEVGTNGTNGNGAYLTQGGTWTNTCDVNRKEDFSELDKVLLLKKIEQLHIQQWRYKGTAEYHIGPTAQQFHSLFHLGADDKGISTVDPAGIALAVIQELVKQNQALAARISRLEQTLKAKK